MSIYATGPEYFFEGNVRHFSLLALVQDQNKVDCTAFNQISVTFDDGDYQTLANGKIGLTPFIDETTFAGRTTDSINNDIDLARFTSLDLTANTRDVAEVHFEVALECSGNAMDGTTQVSGQVLQRICGDPTKGGTKCLIGNEKRGIEFAPESITSTSLNNGQIKVIHSRTYDEPIVLDTFNKFGTIFFKHETYPQLNFLFNTQNDGILTASYDSLKENQKIIAQFGLIENTDPSGKKTGGQPTPPDPSTEIQKGLRINSWSPQILDISNNDHLIDVSIGIENLDLMEITPTLKVTKLDGFVKQEFNLPNSCKISVLGWQDCNTMIDLDLPKYLPGSYKLELSTESRIETAIVSIEVVDQTMPPPPDDRDGDGIPDDSDLCPDEPETINQFQDTDGCPDEAPPLPPVPGDLDGDGILDNDDQCPTEPETINDFEDTDGCPDTPPVVIPPPSSGGGGSGGGGSGGGGSGGISNTINEIFEETIVTDSGVTITRNHTPQLLQFGALDNQTAVLLMVGGVLVSTVAISRFIKS